MCINFEKNRLKIDDFRKSKKIMFSLTSRSVTSGFKVMAQKMTCLTLTLTFQGNLNFVNSTC